MVQLKSLTSLAVVTVALVWCAAPAGAQSVIAGQVRDTSGALLPGALVEASSPALIEGRRTVVTNGQGQYALIDLRPGVYTVTFSLEGFSRVVREGIQLSSNFTATVDIAMNLSSLQETVTVSGASPIVDVTQTQRSTVFSRELMNALPTSNNVWSLAQLAPGITISANDVGGSSNGSDREMSAHGLSSTHTVIAVDGMMANTTRSDGRASLYFQDLANEEVVFDTAGGSAEVSSGGLRINMIPRDGGNRRDLIAFLGGSSGRWQADNFTDRLKKAGMQSVDKIDRIFDYGGTHGGPLVRNRLWYVISARYWGTYDFPADNFLDDGSPWKRIGGRTAVLPRLTFQATPRDKFALHVERTGQFRGPKLTPVWPPVVNGLGKDPETTSYWRDPRLGDYLAMGKWTSTVTNRLLLEVSGGRNYTNSQMKGQPGVLAPVGTPEWYEHVSKSDADLGTFWNSFQFMDLDGAWKQVLAGSASYVTGSHNIKVGFQDAWGHDARELQHNGHIANIQYRTGVPNSVAVTNDPAPTVENVKYDLGLYAQDRWTFNRLSLNGGIRFEWLNAYVAAQDVGAGRYVGSRHFDAVENVPDWFNISPRVGLAYDLFGDAKTAIKFTAGKYSTPLATSLARSLNPVGLVTVSIPWNDSDLGGRLLSTNNDGIAQDSELDLTRLPTNFGVRNLARLDPDTRRETNIEFMLGVQHSLTSRIALSVNWFRRAYENKRTIDNLERDLSDFRAVPVVSPLNGEVINVYDVVSATEIARVDQVIRNASFTEIYNGLEAGVDVRIRGGGRFLVNVGTQRIIQNDCDQDDDPNLLRFCDRGNLDPYKHIPFRTDLKIAGSLPLPFGVQISGTLMSVGDRGKFDNNGYGLAPTYLISRTTRYTEAQCAGRPCTAGALVIPGMVLSSVTVPLAPSGTEIFLPRLTQLDLGVKKTFRAAGASWEPRLDVFNVLNADTEQVYRSTQFDSPVYLVPGSPSLAGFSSILFARVPRLSLQVKW